MPRLDAQLEAKLAGFALTLVDQQRAAIVIPPQQNASGFWFGGGNTIEAPDGKLYLVGRYRNFGDSRTGLGAGQRGLELGIFCSEDRGQTFKKQLSFSKPDLNVGEREVLSIEGSSLHWTEGGVELFVSTEKDGIEHPPGFASFLKPNTGVWTIERLFAASVEGLKDASLETVLESNDPSVVHVKDPFSYDAPNGDLVLLYCTHPYSWASSNTAYAIRSDKQDEFGDSCFDFFPRGLTWDIAITRGTCVLDVPPIGAFADRKVSLLFYDGGESLRNLDEHNTAVKRPRGYSCEEIGGVAYVVDDDISRIYRLSQHQPFFISPHGTGCSRYVDVLSMSDGFFVTWQQSQADLSQPLVSNFVARPEAERLLI
ncbi:MAG: hypothetical protein CMJ64_01240 [Planctomycetaceae bacterium]|nr:hypothetical protein [Planctomycetaceae bacterium]